MALKVTMVFKNLLDSVKVAGVDFGMELGV